MAEIAFGFGSSHGSLLVTRPEDWVGRAAADRRNKALAFRGRTYAFDELDALRKAEKFAQKSTIEARRAQHARCQENLDRLAETLDRVAPDVVLIVGDDQHEWFSEDVQPSYAVFCGDIVESLATSEEEIAQHRAEGRLVDPLGYHPPSDARYPVARGLAEHVITSALGDGFDVTACMRQPKEHGSTRPINLGHAYGFIYRRILRDRPIPVVPILVNTFYPPNQPVPKRCVEFGRAIGRAIKSWPENKRVAVCASGGLSHFVVDEAFDRKILGALERGDLRALMDEPDAMFRSGTSETKNWLIAAGILAETDFRMTLLDYVPCYRSEAGTGNAMAFATWQ